MTKLFCSPDIFDVVAVLTLVDTQIVDTPKIAAPKIGKKNGD